MCRERLERLLREPDNLFGPPTGRGYDYLGAGLTVGALALGALSGWCLLTAIDEPAPHPALRAVFLFLAAPFCIGVGFLWPFNLVVGWLGAVAVWYATLHTIACRTGRRRCGRWSRIGSALVSAAGWAVGLALVLWRSVA